MQAPHRPLTPRPTVIDQVDDRRSAAGTDQVVDGFAAVLADAAAVRRAHLDRLPEDGGPVAAAHRASVERILDAICAAQARIAAGTYGTCTRCGVHIDAEALWLRPWAATCWPCGGR